MDETVRFLVIGVGGMGRAHLANLLEIHEARVVGLVDPSQPSIEAARSRFPALIDVPSFSTVEEALARVKADAAVIVTPHLYHYEQGSACINAGLHVLMEKPFVAGSQNAKKIIELARGCGKHLAVSYQRHLQGPYLYVRNLLQSGVLGEVEYISAYQAQAWKRMTQGTWRQDPELACGGQLNDSGSHLLDVVLWLTGLTPDTVLAHIDTRGTRVDIDSVLTVSFLGGAIASFNIVGSASIDWWEDVSIHCTKGTALYRNGRIFVAKEGDAAPTEVLSENWPESSNPDQNFVDLVLGRTNQPAAEAACGLAVATLTEAAWKSSELEQRIKI